MRAKFGSLGLACLLALGGCSAPEQPMQPTDHDTSVSVQACRPATFIPAAAVDQCSSRLIAAMTTRLVRYDPDTMEPINAIAATIDSDDLIHWTVTLRDDWTFHDGTAVTASSFVDAWNYSAAPINQLGRRHLFSFIRGYGEDKLEGLQVVDDRTFTVETNTPTANFATRLGNLAFAPLPESFFENPQGFGAHPVGTGPFSFAGATEDGFRFDAYSEYSGPDHASVDHLDFRIYEADSTDPVTDIGTGILDYAVSATTTVGERRDLGAFVGLAVSPDDEYLASNYRARHALSLAIDRATIAATLVGYDPAYGWAPPTIHGSSQDACPDLCHFSPDAAREAWPGDYDGPLTITVSEDSEEWAKAVARSIATTLGIATKVQALPDAELVAQRDAHTLHGLVEARLSMDYPSPEDFLASMFASSGHSNTSRYRSSALDAKLNQAGTASSLEAAGQYYEEAETIIAEDMPVIPLWYPSIAVLHSSNVTAARVDAFGLWDYSSLRPA